MPPGDGWTRDPFAPVIEDGVLYGRGSGDAKASVSAMLYALGDVAASGGPPRGRLLAIFSYGEETRNATMPEAVQRAGRLDAALVGEPTNLEFAVAQRGLMMVDLVAHGEQRHAGYAEPRRRRTPSPCWPPTCVRLDGVVAERGASGARCRHGDADDARGRRVPQRHAARRPRRCSMCAPRRPGRTTSWKQRCASDCASEVVVTSKRLVPCETPPDSALLAAARAAAPDAAAYGSPTCSDWCFLRHLDAIKVGPGTSRRSHTPDEAVDLAEVTAARAFYARRGGAVPDMKRARDTLVARRDARSRG